ncbi:MAG TPA: RDD family protein [Streptosporangiaceae bacterium]|jgi:uncharacterized RDD family membrane protein YckC
MTQPPDDTGGQPDANRAPGTQEGGQPAPPPPPDSWHFPPEPVPPPVQQAYTAPPPPYGTSPQYGTPPPYGRPPPQPNAAQQQYGTPPPYGTQSPYGTSYGTSPQPGAPQPYGPAYPSYGTGLASGPEPDLAEWWRRLLGRLIDALVVAVVLTPAAIPLLSGPLHRLAQVSSKYPNINSPGAQSALASADGKLFGAFWVIVVITAVIWFLYDSLQHAKWGQTLGKRAMSTRVVSAYDRSPITGAAAAKRAAVYALIPVIPLIGSLFALLNELWLLWDRRRQCLHDKAAHTIVIKTNVPAAGNWQQPQPPPW